MFSSKLSVSTEVAHLPRMVLKIRRAARSSMRGRCRRPRRVGDLRQTSELRLGDQVTLHIASGVQLFELLSVD